jgi:hypothetical protein
VKVSFASEPGSPGIPNEDTVIATAHTVVVLDGLSSPQQLGTGCLHGTPWYVKALATRLVARIELGVTLSLPEAFRLAVLDVADLHRDTCDLTDPGTPMATVAVLAQRDDRLDYLVLADATVVIETTTGFEVITDLSVENIAREQITVAHALPTGSPEHAAAIADLVMAQRRHRNQPGGYWVAAADPSAADHAVTGSMPLSAVSRAAVMSDGAARLVDLFRVADWPTVLTLMNDDGPGDLIRWVREIEASDSDGTRWPRYKCSDDATTVHVVL